MTLLPGPAPEATAVTVWWLETRSPEVLRPSPPRDELVLMRAGRPAPELSRFFYGLVGARWWWVDRLGWGEREWRAWVDRPAHHLWTGWVEGVPAGYFELEQQDEGDVEVAYLGLAAGFEGRGLGGWLLTRALREAWALPGTRRVWLHTCSLDGPYAVANYEARGLVRVRETVEWRLLGPAASPSA